MILQAPQRERAASGRHRKSRAGGPASAVTAGIAAGALAVATYAASTATAPSEPAVATVTRADPALAAEAVGTLTTATGTQVGRVFAQVRQTRTNQGVAALSLSTDLSSSGADAVRDASKAITKQKKKAAAEKRAEEKRAAEEAAAAQRAAEQRAAEQRAAEESAAAERAAEQRAAEEAAAAERAAERRESDQAASRSSQRQAPAPRPAPVSSGDARSIARSMLGSYGWGDDQWGCLDSLWMRESGWNHTAMNASSGAYGIPQSLPGNKMATVGADWQTNPATQIQWGLGYISGRYGSPCGAWAHSESVGWY
ncbi:aggregation-promoting factor C-terminal-like domain-containing protein [Ornithinimicrobium avium]|uniref:Lytic transglycosylase domain-containing protein n=1 Tax=Ornithinimicrobium avium TaxID=2283195 RepID=A0A345NQN0_9MICO|nr:lytic transglycosylase domain-containing protein [Ornithinimicrobium avium]AXH97338.1 lytic transglycosylase domain-containing protein [Ornithinimicrobium avium]